MPLDELELDSFFCSPIRFVYTNLMDYSVHCYRSWLNIVQNPKFLDVCSSKFSFESQITLKFSYDLSRCSNLLSMSFPISPFFSFFFGWMILIYVADCIALLLTTSIFYMGCQWTLIITIGYYLSFLINTLSFCIIMCMFVFFVLIKILVWLIRKCRDKFWIFI